MSRETAVQHANAALDAAELMLSNLEAMDTSTLVVAFKGTAMMVSIEAQRIGLGSEETDLCRRCCDVAIRLGSALQERELDTEQKFTVISICEVVGGVVEQVTEILKRRQTDGAF